MQNRVWRLARTPLEGWPTDGDFVLADEPLPEVDAGQALTRCIYLSLDPYQWGRRRGGAEAPGDVCHGRTVAQVVRSRMDGYQEGDFVFNTVGWQTHGLMGRDVDVFGYMFPRLLDPNRAPISTAVGVLGMLGLTAYSGTLVQCDPKAGETVVVSAASGGVGQVAAQLARIRGCRVVGIAGAPAKCAYVSEELGVDACVSHLSPSYEDDLAAACPDGIDVYFENVGGKVFAGVLPLLNRNARISLCGMISQYGNAAGEDAGTAWQKMGAPTFERQAVAVHRLFVRDYVADYQERFFSEMAAWIDAGDVKYREDLWQGIDAVPAAFAAMLKGGNFGKTLVQIGDDPSTDAMLEANRAGGNTIG